MTAPALPFGHTAVMAQRQPDPEGLDYFPTPPWAARAGGELVKRLDPAARSCWEPACGGGHMAFGLRDYFDVVAESDIADYGPSPAAAGRAALHDFLGAATTPFANADWIISNPPFKDGEAFIRTAWAQAKRGVAMLLRLAFVESAARYELFQDIPLTVLAPFSERVPMVKGRWDPEASSATAYAWFVFDRHANRDHGGAAFAPRLHLIPPGTRARLSQAHDVRLFGGGLL